MAEDQTSREILEQLVERLDHLERVLQSNTMRLHTVERRVGLEPPPPDVSRRTIFDTHAGERDEAQPTATGAHAAERDGTKSGPEAGATQAHPFAAGATQAHPFAAGATQAPPSAARSTEAEARRATASGAASARTGAARVKK